MKKFTLIIITLLCLNFHLFSDISGLQTKTQEYVTINLEFTPGEVANKLIDAGLCANLSEAVIQTNRLLIGYIILVQHGENEEAEIIVAALPGMIVTLDMLNGEMRGYSIPEDLGGLES